MANGALAALVLSLPMLPSGGQEYIDRQHRYEPVNRFTAAAAADPDVSALWPTTLFIIVVFRPPVSMHPPFFWRRQPRTLRRLLYFYATGVVGEEQQQRRRWWRRHRSHSLAYAYTYIQQHGLGHVSTTEDQATT